MVNFFKCLIISVLVINDDNRMEQFVLRGKCLIERLKCLILAIPKITAQVYNIHNKNIKHDIQLFEVFNV